MTLTREAWDSFSDKARWDIYVSMRGPDSYYGETLKWFTTAVIRGRVSRIYRVGGSVNSRLKMVILPDERGSLSFNDKQSWNAVHFIEHIEAAASWLQIPILWIPEKLWHQCMSLPGRKAAAEEILEQSNKSVQVPELKLLAKHIEELKKGIC